VRTYRTFKALEGTEEPSRESRVAPMFTEGMFGSGQFLRVVASPCGGNCRGEASLETSQLLKSTVEISRGC
jgi:hypothetical protein